MLSGPLPDTQTSHAIRRARRALEQGKPDKAQSLCAGILRHHPHDVDALHLLGMLYFRRGQFDDALSLLRVALTIDARHAAVTSDLGLVLLTMARFDEALACYDRARELAPDDGDALNGRGVALLRLDRVAEALASFDAVLARDPGHIDALGNRGNALLRLNRPRQAIVSYEAALKMAPGHPRLLTNCATALRRLDRPHEALTYLTKALAGHPDFAEARFVQGLAKLTLGDFGAGWKAYESRWATAAFAAHRREFAAPLWTGERSIAGKTILLHGEQGCGDTIQFVRYAPRVAALGARVILEVQPQLAGLVSRMEGIDAIVPQGTRLPGFDFHCPLMSLPRAFGTELATIPAAVPYLAAAEHDRAVWRKRLSSNRPLVGVVWAGAKSHQNDLNRSMRLATLRSLFDLPNVRFVSLQQDVAAPDADLLQTCPQVIQTGRLRDFAETAAVIAQLDVVVSVDTAVAHLAGAMGKPLLLMLPFAADFRWLRERPDSPWYPTARLFRQREFNDWASVIDEVRDELIRLGGPAWKYRQDGRADRTDAWAAPILRAPCASLAIGSRDQDAGRSASC